MYGNNISDWFGANTVRTVFIFLNPTVVPGSSTLAFTWRDLDEFGQLTQKVEVTLRSRLKWMDTCKKYIAIFLVIFPSHISHVL